MIEKILGLPPVASAHGAQIDYQIFLVHILMAVLFLGWGVFFVTVLWRFNKSRHPKANYSGVKNHVSSYIEIGVAVVEAVLLIGFSIPFWAKNVDALPSGKDVVEVNIIAEQFAWNIQYPGPDGVFGKRNLKYFDKQSNPIGLDPADPAGKDDIVTINQLTIPVNRTVLIHLSSKDVIHSFSIPLMRSKQDVIPGLSIPLWFKPVQIVKAEIACAQLCGLGHYRMKGYVNVVSAENYANWLAEQAAPAKPASQDDFWN